MGKHLDEAHRTYLRGGFWLPFGLLAIGIYFLIKGITFNFDDLVHLKGTLIEYRKTDNIYLKVEGFDKEILITDPEEIKKVESILEKGKAIELWATQDDYKIKQLKINGKMILEFNRWKGFIIPLIFIVVSVIFIPLVIKERRKHAEYFGDDKLFGKSKYEEEQ